MRGHTQHPVLSGSVGSAFIISPDVLSEPVSWDSNSETEYLSLVALWNLGASLYNPFILAGAMAARQYCAKFCC